MKIQKRDTARIYFLTMAAYWLVFGLITAFYPKLMDMFQTAAGTAAKTAYSDHVWRHDGFDILSISVLLFALAGEALSRNVILAAAIVASLVTFAIILSLATTPYWNSFFIVPCVGCFSFAVWGFWLTRTKFSSERA